MIPLTNGASVLAAFLFLVVCISFSNVSTARDHLTGLQSKDRVERQRAADLIRKDRETLIIELIKFAAEKVKPLPSAGRNRAAYPYHDSKHLAILLLGDLRAVEAIPVLLDNIEYENVNPDIWPPPNLGGWFPAAGALAKIGMPAIDPVIKKLGTYADDGRGRRNCSWILEQVYSKKLAKARLEMAIERTHSEDIKANLSAALVYFEGSLEITPFPSLKRPARQEKQRPDTARTPPKPSN